MAKTSAGVLVALLKPCSSHPLNWLLLTEPMKTRTEMKGPCIQLEYFICWVICMRSYMRWTALLQKYAMQLYCYEQ